MARPRFSIAALLLVVIAAGVAVAALRASTDAWDGGVLGVPLLALLTSVLLAGHRRGRRRAFWLGFALFGWAYLVMSLVPPIEARLPTTRGLGLLDSLGPGRTITMSFVPYGTVGGPGTLVTTFAFASDGPWNGKPQGDPVRFLDVGMRRFVAWPNGTLENYMRIGHSLLALVLAFLGAHL